MTDLVPLAPAEDACRRPIDSYASQLIADGQGRIAISARFSAGRALIEMIGGDHEAAQRWLDGIPSNEMALVAHAADDLSAMIGRML